MTDLTETTSPQQRGKPFEKGQSGNPNGRPKGARHKTTLAIQALLDGEAENITRKAVEAALGGDMVAIRLVMERVLPARKDHPVTISLPCIKDANGAMELMQALMDGVSNGDITPLEANSLAGIVEQWRKTYETIELKTKLEELKNIITQKRN